MYMYMYVTPCYMECACVCVRVTVDNRGVPANGLGVDHMSHQFGQPLRIQKVEVLQSMVVEMEKGSCNGNTILTG